GQRRLERGRVGHGRPAFALDRQGRRAGRRFGGRPWIAVALVMEEEGGREDVAGAGGVHLAGRPGLHLEAVAVDIEERPRRAGGDDGQRHALHPLGEVLLLAADVLGAHEQRRRPRGARRTWWPAPPASRPRSVWADRRAGTPARGS